MKLQDNFRWDYQTRLLAWIATCVAVISFQFYFRRGDGLLYGDASAHINIARRVFDSKTPGPLQLGTVWLPLPHLLMMPFLISAKLWRSGAGGSAPSLAAYVLGVLGIFRLTRELLAAEPAHSQSKADMRTAIAPWVAALIYGANPNLIYMQTTAMTEALYLAFFIWSVVYFVEFLNGESSALIKCGLCVAGASLSRYDGWFLSATVMLSAIVVFAKLRLQKAVDGRRQRRLSMRLLSQFLVISAAGPLLWLAYNAAVYRNPLEFATGPYSAKAIEQKTGTINPARGNLFAAGAYFVKAADLNVAEQPWLGWVWILLSAAGLVGALCFLRDSRAVLLLFIPLPFYALAVSYGSVPIFVPQWRPFSQYNLRYGLELLPAFAVSLALFLHLVQANEFRSFKASRLAASGLVFALVAASYALVWKADPICYREASINNRRRISLEAQVAKWLEAFPPNSTLLMYLAAHPGAVEQAGIPLRRIINEGNHRVWKQPADPDGLWERCLEDPPKFADYAIAFEGDPVWRAVNGRGFRELVEIKTSGEPKAVLYQLR